MTPEAKKQLSSTDRALRARMLADLHAATQAAPAHERARLDAWLDEQLRARAAGTPTREALRRELAQHAAYTAIHRLVLR